MNTKERATMQPSQQAVAAMRLALEALEAVSTAKERGFGIEYAKGYVDPVIAALREALAEQAEQEPVGVVEGSGEWGIAGVLVAGVSIGTKLYAAPVRTKDLTDDEIHDVFKSLGFSLADPRTEDFSVARAVIAADREKNK